jgi:ribosome maturation factor RimP
MTTDTARLQQICESSLSAVGYELVEMEYVREGSGWVLRVYIDHPCQSIATPSEERVTSAISLSDCELASRQLGTTLDVEDVIENAYRLEVSSPGVERPLRKERDFARFIGRAAKVQLGEPLDGRRNFSGRISSAEGGVVGLQVGDRVFQLPIQTIHRAHLEVEHGVPERATRPRQASAAKVHARAGRRK